MATDRHERPAPDGTRLQHSEDTTPASGATPIIAGIIAAVVLAVAMLIALLSSSSRGPAPGGGSGDGVQQQSLGPVAVGVTADRLG